MVCVGGYLILRVFGVMCLLCFVGVRVVLFVGTYLLVVRVLLLRIWVYGVYLGFVWFDCVLLYVICVSVWVVYLLLGVLIVLSF